MYGSLLKYFCVRILSCRPLPWKWMLRRPHPVGSGSIGCRIIGPFGSVAAVRSTVAHSRSTFNCGRIITLPKPSGSAGSGHSLGTRGRTGPTDTTAGAHRGKISGRAPVQTCVERADVGAPHSGQIARTQRLCQEPHEFCVHLIRMRPQYVVRHFFQFDKLDVCSHSIRKSAPRRRVVRYRRFHLAVAPAPSPAD